MPKGGLGRKKTQHSKSKASSVEKGNALEQAVRAIETAILTTSPVYQGNTFIISSKKKLRVKDVQHEIDVWVEIDLCKGYKSRFIFECRNRKKRANKNDIMLFSAIIAAVQAQTDFFIAKSFTKDARPQAQQEPESRCY